MRLTLVIASLGRGGAERAACVLASAWAAGGNEVTLITLVRDDAPAYSLHPSVRLQQLRVVSGPAKNLVHGMFRQLKCVRILRQALIASSPDLIVSFMNVSNIVTLLAARGLRAPVIITEHTDPVHYIGWQWQILRRFVYRRAAALVCMTKPVVQWFEKRMKVKGVVIPNPIEAVPLRADISPLPDKRQKTAVAMGRLSREKGFDLLLDAFSRIAARHPDWQLKILGDGPLRSDLLSQADKLKLSDRVQFTGSVSDPYPLLAGSDLFVFSSRFEGFGNALCEAMACGLPVISFDCPSGPREIIRDGVDGLLVPAANIAALAATMDRLMLNPQERARLASRAPEITERFGLKPVLALWTQLFEELLFREREASKSER